MNNAKDNYTRNVMIKSGVIMAVLILITIIVLAPIYILFVNATHEPQAITNQPLSFIPGASFLRNIKETMRLNEIGKISYSAWIGYRNSFFITVSATALCVFFSSLTAYGLVIYDFKLSTPAYTFILAVMMVPVQVTSVGFVQFMSKLKLTDTYWPLIVPAIAAPAIVFYMRQYMKANFPTEIVEAARIDGSGELSTFVRIAIPMLKPAVGVQAIFCFIANWNNFYTPSIQAVHNAYDGAVNSF